MNDAALLDSLHAALRNPDLAWYTEFHAGESIVAGYLDSLTDPYDGDAIQVPEGWFRYSVVTREGDHALPWMEHWNEYEYSITHHIDWNGKGFTPYDLYCTQDLTGMIDNGTTPDPARIDMAMGILGPLEANAPTDACYRIIGLKAMLSLAMGDGEKARELAEQAIGYDASDRFASSVLDRLPETDPAMEAANVWENGGHLGR